VQYTVVILNQVRVQEYVLNTSTKGSLLEKTVIRPDGTVLCVTRKCAKLTDDVVPSILYKEPIYISEKLPLPTQPPSLRAILYYKRDHLSELDG
jgi:hypothetical protein